MEKGTFSDPKCYACRPAPAGSDGRAIIYPARCELDEFTEHGQDEIRDALLLLWERQHSDQTL
jgi:hypothetical protein